MNQPIFGEVYALTGGSNTPSIANGNTWEESRIKMDNDWKIYADKKQETINNNKLSNRQVTVTFDGECVHIYDNLDKYNDTKGFSQTKLVSRAKKAFDLIKLAFNESMTFGQAERILDDAGAKMHTYCGMD